MRKDRRHGEGVLKGMDSQYAKRRGKLSVERQRRSRLESSLKAKAMAMCEGLDMLVVDLRDVAAAGLDETWGQFFREFAELIGVDASIARLEKALGIEHDGR